jgi:hypothetical protein
MTDRAMQALYALALDRSLKLALIPILTAFAISRHG